MITDEYEKALNNYHKAVADIYKSRSINPQAQRALDIANAIISAAKDVASLAATVRTKSYRAFRKKYSRKPNHYNRAIAFKIWQRMISARVQVGLIASRPIPKDPDKQFESGIIEIGGNSTKKA